MIVGIDARLRSGQPGGVEQFVLGLAHGLSKIEPESTRYLFLTLPGEDGFLRPFLHGPCTTVSRGPLATASQWATQSVPRRVLEIAPGLRRLRSAVRNATGATGTIPESDGTLERAGANLVHFPMQSGFRTQLPTIYQPWDLQHLHLPELFTADVIASREKRYREFCARARFVVVATEWAKNDFIQRYNLDESKVVVVPIPPPIAAYADVAAGDTAQFIASLPPEFLFYPAQTWRHKNHSRLLEALSVIRDRHGQDLHLVCSGTRNEHYPAIAREAARLRLSDSIHWLGFVPPHHLKAVYLRARALVFPSLFEGWGFPIVEAFASGLPVACSRVTSLPELVGDAAVLFDPYDPSAIADAIWLVWTDESLRSALIRKGHEKSQDLDWMTTAATYQRLYQAVATGG